MLGFVPPLAGFRPDISGLKIPLGALKIARSKAVPAKAGKQSEQMLSRCPDESGYPLLFEERKWGKL